MRRSNDDDPAGYDERRSGTRGDMMEGIDQLSRRLSGALVIAGGLVALGIYSASGGGDAPKYQAFAADGEVFRVNTESGTIIACNAARCMRILERGQELAEDQGNTLFKVPAPPAQPAAQLPPPAPAQPAALLPAPSPQQPAPAAPGLAQPAQTPPPQPR
jgi:hypothetical protein